MKFSVRHLAQHLSATLHGSDCLVEGATIDSRKVVAGSLFVPIVADRDGHEFLSAAVDAGAAAYLCGPGRQRPELGVPAIEVDDTGRALLGAGAFARQTLGAQRPPVVVGVTGSVGKTSTKDLIAAACRRSRVTHANPASFNNELGLPLTLLNAPDDAEVLVLEMGARGIGHITDLCAVARPTVGVVTRVALAHGEQFGSIDGVARAKGELVEALDADGWAVLNADDPLVAAMATRTTASVLTFGRETEGRRAPDVMISGLHLDAQLRPRFRLRTPSGDVDVALEARGAHMADNAAAAVAVAVAVGIDPAAAVEGLTTAVVSRWRMEVATAADGTIVVNDAYNANPTSMAAALGAFGTLEVANRVAVLGAMAELGTDSAALHREVAESFRSAGLRVIAVAAPDYGDGVEHVGTQAEALDRLGPLGAGSAVLVKASRSAGMETLAATLLARPGAAGEGTGGKEERA